MTKEYMGMTVGIYGHSQEAFGRYTGYTTDEAIGRAIEFYTLMLYMKATDLFENGATAIATVFSDGVNKWLAGRIASMGVGASHDRMALKIIVPPDVAETALSEDDKAILAAAHDQITAAGSDLEALCKALVEASDRILLYSFDPENEPVYKIAVAAGVPVETMNPMSIIQIYEAAKGK